MTAFSKKVCLLGDFAVGKTSLVRRLVHDHEFVTLDLPGEAEEPTAPETEPPVERDADATSPERSRECPGGSVRW